MRKKPLRVRAAFGRSRLIFQPYFLAPGTDGGNAVSAEVSEVALLLKFAFREKAVAPLAEVPGFCEFSMRDLNFALFLFRFQSLCLGAFEADAFVFVDPEHLVFGNCFFANFADFRFFLRWFRAAFRPLGWVVGYSFSASSSISSNR